MSESLDKSIAEKFAGVSDAALIRKMERAPDFGYDDESYELTRRLKLGALAWRWAQIDGRDRVETYTPDHTDHEFARSLAVELHMGWASNLAAFAHGGELDEDQLIGEIQALTESKYVTDEGKRLATWLGHYVVANTNEEGDLTRGGDE